MRICPVPIGKALMQERANAQMTRTSGEGLQGANAQYLRGESKCANAPSQEKDRKARMPHMGGESKCANARTVPQEKD